MTETPLYQVRAKNIQRKYEVDKLLHGDRISIKVDACIKSSKAYLLCRIGTITSLGKKAIVLIDATEHKEAHEVELDLGVLEKCLLYPNLTCVRVWEPVSPSLELSTEHSSCVDCANKMNSAACDCAFGEAVSKTLA